MRSCSQNICYNYEGTDYDYHLRSFHCVSPAHAAR